LAFGRREEMTSHSASLTSLGYPILDILAHQTGTFETPSETLDSGRLRYIPAASGEPDRYIEMEGAPDLVVEIVSNSSERKDLVRLPLLYAAAGIPEIWLVDVRKNAIHFEIRRLGSDGYELVKPDAKGWRSSPRLGRRFRLKRYEIRPGRWIYRLEHDGEG
jgi:Uma2 family endonuclease